jgi:hypothetical protein
MRLVYQAPTSEFARMMIDVLAKHGIRAVLGLEKADAGVFGLPQNSQMVYVREEDWDKAKEIAGAT